MYVDGLKMRGTMEQKTLYIKLEKNVEICSEDIYLKDLGRLYCNDDRIINKCKCIKVSKLAGKNSRKIISVMKVIELVTDLFPNLWVQTIGETDVVVEHIEREREKKSKEILKVIFVSGISFFGTAFTIMAFHNDIAINDLFNGIHRMITGENTSGYSVLEVMYSIGLAIGIIVFFNHIGGKRISKDPTPIEVEMRIYEDEVNQTLVDYADRMNLEIDVEK